MKTRIFFVLLISLLLSLTQSVKADTIHITLTVPFQTQNFCQDSMNFDTFIIHKNQYFTGIPTWYISNLPVAVCDSFVYVPTSSVSVLITAIWNYNEYGVRLNLYSTPPSHANFEIFSGGSINTAGDTAYMCGMGGLSLGANALGDESFTWYGPGGFTSTSNPIAVTTPGIYVFERLNPCGTTRDSVEVIYLPVTIPVWSDTTFCNVPVNLTLDPGPGWNYLWNTGATTQTLTVSDSGFYKVRLSNQCVVLDSAWIHVSQVNFPLPDLAAYSQIPAILCQSEVVLLNPNADHTYDTYQWYKGSTPVGNQPTLTVDYPTLGEGSYVVEVTQGGCSATSMTMVMFYSDPQAPMHCVSSFDPLTGTNMTVFEVVNAFDVTEYVLSYKQGSIWVPVDTIAETGLSSYTLYDSVNDPDQQSQTYAVFARHLCGNLSPLGDWHKTIRIGIFQDIITGDYILQILDDYTTLSEYEPDFYTIWIDSLNNGNFTQIGILNGGNTSFTITSPVIGAAYYISVNLPWDCGGDKSFPVAFSNRKIFNINDVAEYGSFSNLTIYPNPSTGIFQIDGESVSRVEVTDIFGRLLQVVEHPTSTLDLSAFDSGVYNVRIHNQQWSTNRQVMIVR